MQKPQTRPPAKRRWIYYFLIILTAGTVFTGLWLPRFQQTFAAPVEAGQVTEQDYRALQSISFTSETLTAQRQAEAERQVQAIYTPPEPIVARQQLERLNNALAYITSVRADRNASSEQKQQDLAAMEDIRLDQASATSLLALSDARWQAIQQEANDVLEGVMRSAIRPDNLQDALNRVPSLVSLSFPQLQADLVSELASAFVSTNSKLSEELTEAARQAARDNIEPVVRNFVSGQIVVSQGQVLTEADIETLEELNLIQPRLSWQDISSAIILAFLMTALLVLYLRRHAELTRDLRRLLILNILFLVVLLSARAIIPAHAVIPFAIPISAYALTVSALFGNQIALATTLPLAILVSFGMSNALELTLYYTISSLFGILALGRARRVSAFFWAGLAVALSGMAVVIIYRLPQTTTDTIGIVTLNGASLFNGMGAASLTILLQFLLAHFLSMITPMQLMDLTRPDNPVLQTLLHQAPGTYQHSLQVANLAEQAAERIGADPLLTRVGALYHDIGKIQRPIFYVENQIPGGVNPHENLEALESSTIIRQHVPDGLEIGRKQRLPRRILDFIAEHHGTTITRYQYVRAVKAAGGDANQVDIELFRYAGPRPQSRETAILMLADGSEARVRAERPHNEAELNALIKDVIQDRLTQGQLDSTPLTFRDLEQIADSFATTLRGIYHPRIKYPTLPMAASTEAITRPSASAPDNSSPDEPAGAEVKG